MKLSDLQQVADATPPSRSRAVDTWRAIALAVVVFGHWLSASVWVQTDGTVDVGNVLEWFPGATLWTWVVQVMPIFFFVGGFANARALGARSLNRRSWIVHRYRRLSAPAVPMIVVWAVLALTLANLVDADLVYAGVLNATIPLWFLAVYLMLITVAPFTLAAWRRFGMSTVVALAAGAVMVDIAYRVFDIPGIGWANLIFVWGAVHQLGYWWADKERSQSPIPVRWAAALFGCSLTALIAVTTIGWYPAAMLVIPGAGPQNVTPPTSAIMLLGFAQAGVILATTAPISRWAARRRPWRLVVGVSAFMMTIYVWHLTALSLVIAIGVFVADGVAFSAEPGTVGWWLTRPIFYGVLIAVTAGLVAVFARFEHDIDRSPPSFSLTALAIGMAGTVIALSATSFVYLVDRDANVAWWIPLVAVASAALLGAYPASWRRGAHRSSVASSTD